VGEFHPLRARRQARDDLVNWRVRSTTEAARRRHGKDVVASLLNGVDQQVPSPNYTTCPVTRTIREFTQYYLHTTRTSISARLRSKRPRHRGIAADARGYPDADRPAASTTGTSVRSAGRADATDNQGRGSEGKGTDASTRGRQFIVSAVHGIRRGSNLSPHRLKSGETCVCSPGQCWNITLN
jgi:hypothetical protein